MKKIDSFLDNLKINFIYSIKAHRLKVSLKKYDFPYINLYLSIYKKIYFNLHNFDKVKYKKVIDNSDYDNLLFYNLISSRLYQMNEEVIFLIDKDFFHSIIALTRGMIEMFMTSFFLNNNPKAVSIFSGTKKNDIPLFREQVKFLKRNKINYEVKGLRENGEIIEEDILSFAEKDWRFFSKLTHPTPYSFSPNAMVQNDGKNIILPYRESKIKEPKEIIFFMDKPNLRINEKISIIMKFLNYSHLTYIELDKLLKKITDNSLK